MCNTSIHFLYWGLRIINFTKWHGSKSNYTEWVYMIVLFSSLWHIHVNWVVYIYHWQQVPTAIDPPYSGDFILVFPCWDSGLLHCTCYMNACSCFLCWSCAVERTRLESWGCSTGSTLLCRSSHRPQCTHGCTHCTQSCTPPLRPPGQWEWHRTSSCNCDTLRMGRGQGLLHANVWCRSALWLVHNPDIQTVSNAK